MSVNDRGPALAIAPDGLRCQSRHQVNNQAFAAIFQGVCGKTLCFNSQWASNAIGLRFRAFLRQDETGGHFPNWRYWDKTTVFWSRCSKKFEKNLGRDWTTQYHSGNVLNGLEILHYLCTKIVPSPSI